MKISREIEIVRSPRVLQIEGIFDVPPAERAAHTWDVDLRLDDQPWQIGLIVGPSGSGKTTIARALWPEAYVHGYDWDHRAIVDSFPATMGVKEIVGLLNHVGLSSPPTWLKPFAVLSTGEQFRVTLARALAESPDLVVLDEFTSVVDRNVARIGSAAVAKAIRASNRRFIAVTCHEDVEEWLQPDWVYQPALGTTTTDIWRSLRRRPAIAVEVVRCDRAAWPLFAPHHYLSTTLNSSATCFLATWDGVPVAFSSWLAFPVRKDRASWREHRTVCLPDYQGVGIGNAVSDCCASLWAGLGAIPMSTTSHPAMIAARTRSPHWLTTRPMGTDQFRAAGRDKIKIDRGGKSWREKGMRSRAAAAVRLSAGFRYIGPPMDPALARRLLER